MYSMSTVDSRMRGFERDEKSQAVKIAVKESTFGGVY